MADNLQNRGPADRIRINTNEEWEVDYWASEFGVDRQTLLDAVARSGNMVDTVRQALATGL